MRATSVPESLVGLYDKGLNMYRINRSLRSTCCKLLYYKNKQNLLILTSVSVGQIHSGIAEETTLQFTFLKILNFHEPIVNKFVCNTVFAITVKTVC